MPNHSANRNDSQVYSRPSRLCGWRESSGYVVFAHTASCCGTQVLDSPVVRAVVIFSLSSVGKKLLVFFFHGSRREGKEHTVRIPREPFSKVLPPRPLWSRS